MRRWLLLGSLLCAQAFGQQAYRWTDENGQVHYSDRPAPGATEVRLRGAQGYSAPIPRAGSNAPSQAEEPASGGQQTEAYTLFNVIQPAQQQTLWNTGSVLTVQVDLQPGLQEGHHLGAYLDGELIDARAISTEFQLTDVFRGTHNLQAVVLDAAGREILRSLPVMFMMQQSSILNPNNPNANPRANPTVAPRAQ
jgi:Domain of unknown function (DUF4124)